MKKLVLFTAGIFSCITINAQNWTGAVNSDWNNPANWSQAPANGSDIEIDPANYSGAMAQPVISSNSSFSTGEMLVQNGGILTISANLSATDRVEVLGEGTEVIITNGTFAVNGPGNNARIVFGDGALLTMYNGAFTIGQRLLFELGGSGVINGGTVTVAQTLALIDGNATTASNLTLNGGTLTTNSEFGFENEAGNYFTWFEQNGGTFNVNGNILWLGADAGSGRGSLNILNGITNVTGTITNDPASTMNMTVEVSGSGAFMNMGGTTISQLAGDSVIISNAGSWTNTNAVTWQNNGVVYSETDGSFTSGNTILLGSGAYQFHNIAVAPGKTLNHVQPAQMAVSGDFAVAGTFIHGSNKLVINGSSDQQVSIANSNLYDVEIINSTPSTNYGVGIGNNLNVSHDIKFTDGLVVVVPGNQINVSQAGTISGGSDSSFVYGYIQKTGNSAVTFPLGKYPDVYRPLSISAPVSGSTAVKVAYKETSYPTLTPVEAPLQSVSVIEYWDLSRTGSSDLFSVTAGWNDASQSGLTNCNDITLAAWDGSEWKFVPSSATGLCDGENAGSLVSSVNLPVIGPLTIGFTGNVYQQVVNICHTDSLTVGDNVYYEPGVYSDVLQGSSGDSTVITVLHVTQPLTLVLSSTVTSISVSAQGATSFQWVNCSNGFAVIPGETGSTFTPQANGSYAVIAYQQYCTAGDTSVCIVISQLGLQEESTFNWNVYPNPAETGGKLTIQSEENITGLVVYSADGKLVFRSALTQHEKNMTISLPEVPAGIYFLEVQTENGRGLKRVIIN